MFKAWNVKIMKMAETKNVGRIFLSTKKLTCLLITIGFTNIDKSQLRNWIGRNQLSGDDITPDKYVPCVRVHLNSLICIGCIQEILRWFLLNFFCSFPQLLYGWDILSIKLPETALEKHNCPGITNAMTAWIYISTWGGGGEKKQKCIVGPLSLEFQSTRAERHTVRKFRNRAHCQKSPQYGTLSEKSAILHTVRKFLNRAHCQKSPQ